MTTTSPDNSASAGEPDVLRLAEDWRRAGHAVALATVVSTWGSAPRQVGSQLVIADDTRFEGSVSGGCVEGAVIGEARKAMEDGKPRLLDFSVSDEMAWEVGLACGGKLKILVERVD